MLLIPFQKKTIGVLRGVPTHCIRTKTGILLSEFTPCALTLW